MSIDKIWINKVSKEDNFIAFNNQSIYRLKVKGIDFQKIENELNNGKLNDKFIGLPISYLRTVEFREDDHNLRFIYNKDSVDSISISDQELRKEIFNYLKDKTSHIKFEQQKPNFFKRSKKPLIALLILGGIFLYIFSLINGLNQGYEYEISGGRARGVGISGLLLGLANLGLLKNILIFSPIFLLTIFQIIRTNKAKSEIYRLTYK